MYKIGMRRVQLSYLSLKAKLKGKAAKGSGCSGSVLRRGPGRVIDAETFEQLMAFDPLGVGLVLARNDQKEAGPSCRGRE